MSKENSRSPPLSTHEDLANGVKQYLELSNSSRILKYLTDDVKENHLSSENTIPDQDGIESLNRSSNYQDGRVTSPASISSLASNKRLEWDSGADVGYQPSNVVHPSLLSTLERMALDGCTESLIRTDPEGTNSCINNRRNPLQTSLVTTDSPSVIKVKRGSISVSSPRELTGVINLSDFANNEAVSLKSSGKTTSPAGGSRKNSATLTGNDTTEIIAPLIIVEERDKFARSADECRFVTSPADDNFLPDKINPMAPLADTVAINSASSSSLASTIVPHNTNHAVPPHSNLTTHAEKVTNRGIQVGGTLKKKFSGSGTSSVKHCSGSEEEIKGLSLNDRLPNMHKNLKMSKKTGTESLDTSSFDCAHSFEYFPGEVYDADSNKRRSKSPLKNATKPERIDTSLSKDLERNIGQISEILRQRETSDAERKVFIKLLVERIVGSEYLDDDAKNSSAKSSITVGTNSPVEDTTNPKATSQENIDVSGKSFVPYRPVPGGRLYHVASRSSKDYNSSSSCYESDSIRSKIFYLPMDRIKITQESSESSEQGSSHPIFATYSEKRNPEFKYNRRMRTLDSLKKCDPLSVNVTKSKCEIEDEKPCCSKESQPNRNWWSPITKSERRHLAAKLKNQRAPLVTYVKQERENQLQWIKNEIKHLTNLVQLLEDSSIVKSDFPASLEEQIEPHSSINKKDLKNVTNTSDKFLCSARSTPVEEPIRATMRWQAELPKKNPVRARSPPQHDTSDDVCCPERACHPSGTESESQSFPSRSSSRNLTNSDIMEQPKIYGRKHSHKQSEAYVITFEQGSPDKRDKSTRLAERKPLKEVRLKVPVKPGRNAKDVTDIHCWTSLQEQLEIHHPHFIKSAEERQKCLEELAHLRSLRQMTRRKLLQCSLSAWDNRLNGKHGDRKHDVLKHRTGVPEKPSNRIRESIHQLCPRYKMRHRVLPEVQKKEAERIQKQSLQTNRMMADIFSRRLQKKVLNGAVSLSNSVSVISSL